VLKRQLELAKYQTNKSSDGKKASLYTEEEAKKAEEEKAARKALTPLTGSMRKLRPRTNFIAAAAAAVFTQTK
jgi:hypothetical protein